MHNITLISTNHKESGKCNSDELYKIIESINPEVIFEELPSERFDDYYNGILTYESLEVKCIKKYLQNYRIKHLPVDIANPNRSSIEILMFEKFERDAEYIKLKSEHNLLKSHKGFGYLNSDKSIDLVKKWTLVEKRILESATNKDMFLHTYELFFEDVYNRENAMLQNIYNYSKENEYNQAVFLLGCGHRKSIIEKIIECEKKSEIKLNWTIFGNE
ncbi:hypothetical protein [Flavobacterium crassostreae]|uniref:Haem-binding uptake Tiki superfamily ChaN domain-containing protein n=1 Tax=Flavobacterium crassostreae TaxID=1763534 RepID=A0A1B9EA89_9FLAO|nr:hypothetical protein [Flavobacterium crassostreae]OCB78857.1 hypothetical protein LPBF_00280 [Flavobacterium crassostreae]